MIEIEYGNEPYKFAPLGLNLRLMLKHGVHRRFWQRAITTVIFNTATTPLRMREKSRYKRQVEATAITHAPIFILGHWRGGTTHLHNLFAKTDQFAYVTTLQTLAPQSYHVTRELMLEPIEKNKPETRIIDNMRLELDGPQEEEYAMVVMSPHSLYHLYTYPAKRQYYLDKYLTLQALSLSEKAEWQRDWLWLLKLATYTHGGKQLVLKSPPHTARIKTILEMFPDAKFIHLYRNPYTIFPSMNRVMQKALALTAMQNMSLNEVQDWVLYAYTALMRAYDEQVHLIPAHNLIEIRYEDLDANPFYEIRRIYDKLGLSNYEIAEQRIRTYMDTIRDFSKGQYRPNAATNAIVEDHWGTWIKRWGYHPPS